MLKVFATEKSNRFLVEDDRLRFGRHREQRFRTAKDPMMMVFQEAAGGAGYLFLAAFLRAVVSRMRLRKRMFFGVTSTNSSSSMYSSASSRVNLIGGVS